MEDVKAYLISITAAALICGVVTAFFDGKGASGAVIRLAAGIFMVLTIAAPFVKFRFDRIIDITDDYRLEGEEAAAMGESMGRNALAEGIISQTEAYILDKAASMGVQLTVQVTVSGDAIPVPQSVMLMGKVSPYEKAKLSQIMEDSLGIPAEDQIWTG